MLRRVLDNARTLFSWVTDCRRLGTSRQRFFLLTLLSHPRKLNHFLVTAFGWLRLPSLVRGTSASRLIAASCFATLLKRFIGIQQ
jgi:hypothetical protein